MKSFFTEKINIPSDSELKNALGSTYNVWQEIVEYVKDINPLAFEEWKYSGDKYGWGFRISDKKRVLVYLLPRDGFFRVAFVFGQKANDAIMESTISESIKNELRAAKAYAEGRGIRIEIRDRESLKDIWNLIEIKINH
jgi:hypothetical protein